VQSVPAGIKHADKGAPVAPTEHCTGFVVKGAAMEALMQGQTQGLLPGSSGLLTQLDLPSIGVKGEGVRGAVPGWWSDGSDPTYGCALDIRLRSAILCVHHRPGLEELVSRHTKCLAGSKDAVYALVNKEGTTEYGPTFQVNGMCGSWISSVAATSRPRAQWLRHVYHQTCLSSHTLAPESLN
jgi:hypothetical protein